MILAKKRQIRGFGEVIDPDALAFITAANITDDTQKNAINTLTITLKTLGLWDKLNCIYPIVGGVENSHKYNLKDPRDLDVAYRLSFSGVITHASTGMTSNGTTGYADSHFIFNNDLPDSKAHISYYSRTNSASAYCEIGSRTSGGTSRDSFIILRGSSSTSDFRVNLGGGVSYADTNSQAFYIASRTADNAFEAYKNGISIGSNSSNFGGISQEEIYIMALNNAGAPAFYSIRECAFATIGSGLDSTESLNLYNTIQTFQTLLGRAI